MNIAITGGTGFLGGHLTRALIARGHYPTVIARGVNPQGDVLKKQGNINYQPMPMNDERKLFHAFNSCDAVAHLSGINREQEKGDFRRVHVEDTVRVIHAARKAGVKKILYVSFLKARPKCFSEYHETKWEAEELVRNSGLDFTVLKPGMIWGTGDHMITHITKALKILPIFAPVGVLQPKISPVAIQDMLDVMLASLLQNRLGGKTCAVLGPEVMTLGDAVWRVARAQGKLVAVIPLPALFHFTMASVLERMSPKPLVSVAQVRMLSEGMDKPWKDSEMLPEDLQPKTFFTADEIKAALGG